MTYSLTPMERAILEVVRNKHWPFLDLDRLAVTRREHTGVGRFTYFAEQADQALANGSYGAGTRYIEMDGVPDGLFFEVRVKDSRIYYVEIVSAGDDSWDGVERPWRMVGP